MINQSEPTKEQMKILSDEAIAEAKRGHTAIVYKDGRPPDVYDSDRAIAREAKRKILEQMVENIEALIIGGRLGEPEQAGIDVYYLDAKGWQELSNSIKTLDKLT